MTNHQAHAIRRAEDLCEAPIIKECIAKMDGLINHCDLLGEAFVDISDASADDELVGRNAIDAVKRMQEIGELLRTTLQCVEANAIGEMAADLYDQRD